MNPGTRAAVEVARQLGLPSDDPLLIQETNNTVVWLRPHPVVAKVGMRAESAETLVREYDVAFALAALGAPAVAPLEHVGPLRDERSGFTVTLWHRIEHDWSTPASGQSVGQSLSDLHAAFDRCDLVLPSFMKGVEAARTALHNDSRVVALDRADQVFLRSAFADLMAQFTTRSFGVRPLHGEPHDGNFVITPEGIRWIDFEAACVGPIEWDLAFLSTEGVAVFPDVDQDLLRLLGALNSARVATWCWVQARFPEMRRHGEFHLARVRERWPE